MSAEMKINVPLIIIVTLVGLAVSFFGWVTNKTLNDINNNITTLGVKIENLVEVRYDHETRLQILERETTNTDKNFNRKEKK